MFLFAFNLYTQINLFSKHIFANKYINTPYYIYSCFALSSPFFAHPDVMPAGEAACHPSPSSPLLEASRHYQPGKLPSVLHHPRRP